MVDLLDDKNDNFALIFELLDYPVKCYGYSIREYIEKEAKKIAPYSTLSTNDERIYIYIDSALQIYGILI